MDLFVNDVVEGAVNTYFFTFKQNNGKIISNKINFLILVDFIIFFSDTNTELHYNDTFDTNVTNLVDIIVQSVINNFPMDF